MLCLSCGLCCDGTMFYGVPLAPDEATTLRGRVRLSDDGEQLLQGCSALGRDCACAVYEVRPQACRRFRCTVLKGLEAGRLTEAEARQTIEEVLALRSALSRALGFDDPRAAMAHVRETRGATISDEARGTFEQLNRALALLQLTMR